MSDFFEQKQISLRQFRENINKFLQSCEMISSSDQFDADTIQELLMASKNSSLVNNGKISSLGLYELLHGQEGGHILNQSDFNHIFGCKKEIKIAEIVTLLKKNDLESFDLVAETKKYFYKDNQFNLDMLSKMMKNMGWGDLNHKSKELVGECFDFDLDRKITDQDLDTLLKIIQKKEGEFKRTDSDSDLQ